MQRDRHSSYVICHTRFRKEVSRSAVTQLKLCNRFMVKLGARRAPLQF